MIAITQEGGEAEAVVEVGGVHYNAGWGRGRGCGRGRGVQTIGEGISK